MKEMDKAERDSWNVVRGKGKRSYILKWILYCFLFIVITQGMLVATNQREINMTGAVLLVAFSIVAGLLISMIRWMILERKFKD